jgi:acetyltransferase EpsM
VAADQKAAEGSMLSRPRDLIVIGGGEHARVVIEAARSRPELWAVLGFVDPAPCAETSKGLAVERLGTDEEALARAGTNRDLAFVIGLGSTGVGTRRREICVRYDALSVRWATVVHARAWVSPTAVLGRGVMVSAGASVNSGARLGDHAVVNTGAIIEHDVLLGPFAQAAPGAAIGGGAVVGAGSYLGLGCRVRDHVRIGEAVTVGMGAVVVGSIPDGEVVMGVPARAQTVRHNS